MELKNVTNKTIVLKWASYIYKFEPGEVRKNLGTVYERALLTRYPGKIVDVATIEEPVILEQEQETEKPKRKTKKDEE